MLDFFQPSGPFESQTLRLVAEAQQGGGDVFDIARLCRNLKPGDKEGWERAWLGLAEATEAKAKRALQSGHTRTGMQNFFHVNQYYRMSDIFLSADEPARKKARFLKSQENFRAAARLHAPPIETITVRCGNDAYDGYFCHPLNPARGKWPAVFLIGGADAFAEEIFAFLTAPLLRLQASGLTLIGTGVPEAFFTKMKVGLIAAAWLGALAGPAKADVEAGDGNLRRRNGVVRALRHARVEPDAKRQHKRQRDRTRHPFCPHKQKV